MASGLQAEDFFDEAEDITDISTPSGIKENEELVRTFNSVVEYPIFRTSTTASSKWPLG